VEAIVEETLVLADIIEVPELVAKHPTRKRHRQGEPPRRADRVRSDYDWWTAKVASARDAKRPLWASAGAQIAMDPPRGYSGKGLSIRIFSLCSEWLPWAQRSAIAHLPPGYSDIRPVRPLYTFGLLGHRRLTPHHPQPRLDGEVHVPPQAESTWNLAKLEGWPGRADGLALA
jgi:hypothetical protein